MSFPYLCHPNIVNLCPSQLYSFFSFPFLSLFPFLKNLKMLIPALIPVSGPPSAPMLSCIVPLLSEQRWREFWGMHTVPLQWSLREPCKRHISWQGLRVLGRGGVGASRSQRWLRCLHHRASSPLTLSSRGPLCTSHFNLFSFSLLLSLAPSLSPSPSLQYVGWSLFKLLIQMVIGIIIRAESFWFCCCSWLQGAMNSSESHTLKWFNFKSFCFVFILPSPSSRASKKKKSPPNFNLSQNINQAKAHQ